jgi:hypothetical protein
MFPSPYLNQILADAHHSDLLRQVKRSDDRPHRLTHMHAAVARLLAHTPKPR